MLSISQKPIALLAGCLFASMVWSASPVLAAPPAHAGPPAHANAPSQGHFLISSQERLFLQNWFDRNLPPGLAKQQKIPPGIAKQLQRGGQWPPQDIQYTPLPPELKRQLSPIPADYEYFLAGTAVVIADLAGGVISDVVYDVLTR